VDHGAALLVPRTDTFPFSPAAAGNERLLPDTVERTDVDETKIRAITFGIKLGCSQAAGNLLTALHGISIQRPFKSRCPARVYVSMHVRDVPDMVAELHGQVPKEPPFLKLADTG
jgi:hypothetical protein